MPPSKLLLFNLPTIAQFAALVYDTCVTNHSDLNFLGYLWVFHNIHTHALDAYPLPKNNNIVIGRDRYVALMKFIALALTALALAGCVSNGENHIAWDSLSYATTASSAHSPLKPY